MKYLGLIMVLVSWSAGALLLGRWEGHNGMSISQHAASARAASSLFALTLVAGGLIFFYWLRVWFVPELRLSPLFVTLLTITVASQIITGLIPDTEGWKKRVHRIAAYGMAVLYFPLSVLILTASTISPVSRVIGVICLSYMIGSFFVFVLLKRARSHFLIAQALYIVSFQVIILAAAYA